ncbi:MAG: hypothetical protein IIB28_07870 [Chloroflexi bacterium]|nr:hypothetical protein [Chloroflexota bacterium]
MVSLLDKAVLSRFGLSSSGLSLFVGGNQLVLATVVLLIVPLESPGRNAILGGLGAGAFQGLGLALMFFMLCAGILSAHPDRGLMAVATSDTAGGLVVRRLLPIAIVIPPILGWLSLQGQQAGLYRTEFGLSLLVVTIIVTLAVVVWAISNLLDRTDTERKRTAEELRLLLTMTQTISEARDFDSALEVAVSKMCETAGWEFGEAWVPRPDGAALECS